MHAKTEMFNVESQDGHLTQLRIHRANAPATGAVLMFPAMGTPAHAYDAFAIALARCGWNVATADLRGIGASSVRAGRGVNFGYHEIIAYDIPAAVQAAGSVFGFQQIVLMGHSLGGQLALLYAAAHPACVSEIVLVATASVYFRAYPWPLSGGLLLGTQIAAILAATLGHFPGRRLGFAGRESRGVTRDWARYARTGHYADPRTDHEGNLRELRIPILSVSIADDSLAPQTAVDHLVAKLNQASVTRRHMPRSAHSGLSHFTWLRDPHDTARAMDQWLKTVHEHFNVKADP